MNAPAVDPRQVQYAGFWRRAAATLIDALLFTLLMTVLLSLLFGREYLDWWMDSGRRGGALYFSKESAILENLIPVLATVILWVKYAGTPGKLLLSCHIVDAETLKPMRPPQAVGRYFAYILSTLPLGLGFLWVAWDQRKQGFHDKLAKTVVIVVDESDKSLEQLEREAM